MPARSFLPLLLAGLMFLAARGSFSTPPAEAAGATLKFPSVACNDGRTASVTFNWAPLSGVSQQWIDVSLADNGFAAGSFISAGPFDSTNASYSWSNLKDGAAHVWRINSLTTDGWVASATGGFVPCGGPAVLGAGGSCADAFHAAVDFRWAPAGTPGKEQWLYLGFDPNFVAGTFTSVGPFTPTTGAYRWSGVQANTDTYYRIDLKGTDGRVASSNTGTFNIPCAPAVNTDIYTSGDNLVMPRLGINAPVNVRDVDRTGALLNPSGPTDVVRYNFPLYPPYGGYPGKGGTTLVAGHLDYHDYGDAVFSPLRNVRTGDEIDYYGGDGTLVRYAVDWFSDLPDDYQFATLAVGTKQDSIILVTCNGTFDFTTRNYDHRRVVHAIKIG